MRNPEFNYPPFTSDLEDTDFDKRIKSLKNDPETIIRQDANFPPSELDKQLARYKLSKEAFQEWRDLDINVLPIDYAVTVVRPKDGQEPYVEAYLATERVHGSRVSKISYSGENRTQLDLQIGQTLESLTKYYERKLQNGGWVIGDVKWDQFVFGHKKAETPKHNAIHFVDVEPFLFKYEKGGKMDVRIIITLRCITGMLEQAIIRRYKFDPQASLPEQWLNTMRAIENLKQAIRPLVGADQDYNLTELEADIEELKKTIQNPDSALKEATADSWENVTI